MNENELKSLWQDANQKLVNSLSINKKNTEEITKLKVGNLISSMKPTKIVLLFLGLIWVLGVGGFVGHQFITAYYYSSPFFLYSLLVQVLLTAIATGVYISQLNLIWKVDFSESVFTIQEKLSNLKVSTLNAARILFLQLPLWSIFYLNKKMFVVENWLWWLLQGLITLCLASLAVWLFYNIKFENRNKKWFRWIFRRKEWQPIIRSMDLLKQIEDYKKEDPSLMN